MTVRVPSWLQAGSFTADSDRLLLQSLLGGSPNQALASGIIGLTDYKVAQTGTASMNLTVTSGAAWLVGTQSSTEGIYNVVNDDNTATVTISTADATNPRIDLVVLQVRNSEYSGTHDDAILTVVTGTPAASPVAPSAPADSIILAQIAVAAAVTTIVTANITDKRAFWLGGSQVANVRGTPAGRIFAGSTQSLGNNSVTVVTVLSTTDFLDGGMLTNGSSNLTVPVAGRYHVTAQSAYSAGGASAIAIINKGGTEVRRSSGGNNIYPAVSDILKLAAGDVLTMSAFQTSGGSLTIQSGTNQTWLSAVLVGA